MSTRVAPSAAPHASPALRRCACCWTIPTWTSTTPAASSTAPWSAQITWLRIWQLLGRWFSNIPEFLFPWCCLILLGISTRSSLFHMFYHIVFNGPKKKLKSSQAWLLQHDTLDINLSRSDGTSALMCLSGMDSLTIEVGDWSLVLKFRCVFTFFLCCCCSKRWMKTMNCHDSPHISFQTKVYFFC